MLANFPKKPKLVTDANNDVESNLQAAKQYVEAIRITQEAFEDAKRAEEATRDALQAKITLELQETYGIVGRLTMNIEDGVKRIS
jgi:hypothetical protein